MADGEETDASGGTLGTPDKKDTPAQKKQVKNEHVLIIVGVVTLVVMVIYMRRSAAQASSSGTSTATSPYGVNSYGASDYSVSPFDTLSSDLQSMQQEIVGLQADSGNGSSSVFSAPTGESLQGSGYWFGQGNNTPISDAGGNTYSWINPNQFEALASSGQPVYYQPAPGVFQPVTPGATYAPGTPLFQRTGSVNSAV